MKYICNSWIQFVPWITLYLVLILALEEDIKAQDSSIGPNIKAPVAIEINEEIRIDGYLDEASWRNAVAEDRFITAEPEEGKVPKHRTEVRILYDKKNFYFGINCYDGEIKKGLRITDLLRDFNDEEMENVAIALDPEQSQKEALMFAVSPNGNILDMEVSDFGHVKNKDWNTIFKAKTRINDSCWVAEFMIPFRSIRYHLKKEQHQKDIGLRIIRVARRDNEVSSFPAYERQFSKFNMAYSAVLKGIKLPKPSFKLEVRPFAIHQLDVSSTSKKLESKTKIGIDIKWALKSSSILDLSINTDFAQVEADQQVVNISRFNVTLPEKRQFFLENSSLFTIGLDLNFIPFSSRNIGIDANGLAIPIEMGLKYVGQSKTQKLGIILVQQQENIENQKLNSQAMILSYQKNLNEHLLLSILLTQKQAINKSKYNYTRNSSLTSKLLYSKKISYR